MNINLYSIILAIAAIMSGITTYLTWKRRPATGAKSLLILMLAITEWILCQLIYISSTSHSVKLFWHELKYLGIVIVPIAFLSLVAEYTNRKKLIKKNIILIFMIIPVITLIIILTNKYHGLFRESINFIDIGNIEVIDSQYGKWFWIFTFYTYALLFQGLVFLLIELIYLPRLYRKQTAVIITGALIPWIWNILYFIYFKDIIYVDTTPLAFSLTGIIAFRGLFRYKFLDLAPIARELVFESIEDIVIVLDKNRRIVDINFSGRKLFKCEDFKIIGKPITEILPEWTKLNNKDKKTDDINRKIVLEEKKEKRHFEVRDTEIVDKKNKVIGILVLLHDITEHEKIMAELKASQKKAEAANRAKSIFLANMSHEIRTPMNGILGMIDLMQSAKLTKEQKENLGIIKDSTESLLTIINDILDYSKIEAGKMRLERTNFNFEKIIKDIIKIFTFQADEKKINIICSIDEEIPNVLVGDPLRLRQIINNLISNAVKFTSEGYIRIEVKMIEKYSKEILLRFKIKDTGIGIPREKVQTLFKSFEQVDSSTTRKYGGTGLGLSIVKNLLELMDGSIEVESEINKGSIFTIQMPFKISNNVEKITDGNEIEKSYEEKFKKINILLAEDNKVNQMIMTKMLKKNSFNVEIAQHGQMVLEKLEKGYFDIIFMDVQMPILDGYETTSKIREKNINTPIIALTANAMKGDREKCLASGMDDYISKPIIYQKLIEIINKYT